VVEQWVSKSYFPPDKCLPICKEWDNLRGEAILTMRGGKPLEAIDVYLKILNEYEIYKMLVQFKLPFKDRPDFLGYFDVEEEEVKLPNSRVPGPAGSSLGPELVRKSFVPDSIVEFDALLGKACAICQKDDLDSEQRMKAWFKILRYLQNFMIESYNKVSEGLSTAKKVYQNNLSMANLKEDDKD